MLHLLRCLTFTGMLVTFARPMFCGVIFSKANDYLPGHKLNADIGIEDNCVNCNNNIMKPLIEAPTSISTSYVFN